MASYFDKETYAPRKGDLPFWGSPSNRSRLIRWATLVQASIIRGRWASFMHGSRRTRTAWTT